MHKLRPLALCLSSLLGFSGLAHAHLFYAETKTELPPFTADPGPSIQNSDVVLEQEPKRPELKKMTHVLRSGSPQRGDCRCPGPEGAEYTDLKVKWSAANFNFKIYTRGTGLEPSSVTSAVMSGFNAWKIAEPAAPAPVSSENYTEQSAGIAFDDENSVSWQPLSGQYGAGAVAAATIWTDALGNIVHFDIAFNSNLPWTIARPESCGMNGPAYDVQSVATHLAGHVFGLGHNDGCNLTMNATVQPGESTKATLGKGDINGIQTKY